LVSEVLLPLFYKLHPLSPPALLPPPQPPLPLPQISPPLPDRKTTANNIQGGGGWNIVLLNVCVTNMAGGMDGGGAGGGRDIGEMFRRQEGVLREFSVYDDGDVDDDGEGGGDGDDVGEAEEAGEEKSWEGAAQQPGYSGGINREEYDRGMDLDVAVVVPHSSGNDVEGEEEGGWEHEDFMEEADAGSRCPLCDRLVPRFAVLAHERYHSLEDP
jgi:DNA polymerase iota